MTFIFDYSRKNLSISIEMIELAIEIITQTDKYQEITSYKQTLIIEIKAWYINYIFGF